MSADVELVSKLGDQPNQDDGLTAEELKGVFDKGPKLLKEYMNGTLVPALNKLLTSPVMYVTMTTADGVTSADQTFAQLREKHLDGFHIRCKYPDGGITVELDAVLVSDNAILFGGMREKIAYSVWLYDDEQVESETVLMAEAADLPATPLISDTTKVKPNAALMAMTAGTIIVLCHNDSTHGNLYFTNFNFLAEQGLLTAHTAIASGDTTVHFCLQGDLNSLAWTLSVSGDAPLLNAMRACNGILSAGDGAAYTADVPGITALTVGAHFVMIPNVVSSTIAPTLNVNGLGAVEIRCRTAGTTGTTTAGGSAEWLTANQPVHMVYDGTYWIADFQQPTAAEIGAVPTSRTINGKVLSANVTLVKEDLKHEITQVMATAPTILLDLTKPYKEIRMSAFGNTGMTFEKSGNFLAITQCEYRISFKCTTAFAVTDNVGIYFTGTSCTNGAFKPVANGVYEVVVRWTGFKWIGTVVGVLPSGSATV